MTSQIAFPYTFPFDFYTIPQSESGVGVDASVLTVSTAKSVPRMARIMAMSP